GDDVNAMSRTGRRTHVTGNALDPALLVAVEPMDTAVVSRQLGLFLGKLLGDVLPDKGFAEVLRRRGDSGKDRRQIQLFEEIELRLLDPLHILYGDWHGDSPLSKLFRVARPEVLRRAC